MLTIILGRAGAGKTECIMNEIRRRMGLGESGLLLVVPEQYSHDAERQLCAVCGDSLPLHGETMSFNSLCRAVLSETGGAAQHMLDAGGQFLVLHNAMQSVAPSLRAFARKSLRAEFLENMQNSIKEFKTLGILPEQLDEAAEQSPNPLRDKLRDISLIYSAYESMIHTLSPGGDSADRMTMLAEKIGGSSVGDSGHIYFDGFNDFTAQEQKVIEELLRKKASITVALTYDPADSGEMFELPRKTLEQLTRKAAVYGVKVTVTGLHDSRRRNSRLAFLEKHLFGSSAHKQTETRGGVEIYAAPTKYSECEHAAHKIWELVRSGFRWRDIGVMARDWGKYGSICENIFEKYGIPFFTGGRTEMLSKPPIALIDTALEIASSGWEYKPVFRYLKTGLAGISADECSVLENYVLKWNIRGPAWLREWTLPPSGYGEALGPEASPPPLLGCLNELRLRITAPLIRLRNGIKGDGPASEKLRALYAFVEDIKLPDNLSAKAEMLEKRFDSRLADEYAQTWGIITNAMEQMHSILGEARQGAADFRKLFMLTLSRYDVGAIPATLDRTTLGGMEMNRRRNLKCLILLGATDDELPMLSKHGGILSGSERGELARQGLDIPAGFEERLSREMNMIYSTLTLPSDKLILTYPKSSGNRPSMIVKKLKTMFGIEEETLREEEYMTSAVTPCLELASFYGNTNSSLLAAAARDYFVTAGAGASEKLQAEDALLSAGRGRLSKESAELLYGPRPALTATRMDKYYACPYQSFMYSGLGLRPRTPAGFDAMTVGTFMHYILENVFSEISKSTGFRDADEEDALLQTARYVEKYAHDVLYDFNGRNERFVYLYRRMGENAGRIVQDMLGELKDSDFKPLDFELDISRLTSGPARPGKERGGFEGLRLAGIVDRVDGWAHDGKLYLRVSDYKTGRKTLSLTNVMHGRDMQMLIYLFALETLGAALYGDLEIIPAGVLYIPARDTVVQAARNATDEEIRKKRMNETRRSGLILNDVNVIDAMENSAEKKYLPVKHTKDGMKLGDSFISLPQAALLSGHIRHMLRRAAREMLEGNADCSPYYADENDNACRYCDYKAPCPFDLDSGDSHRIIRQMKPKEVWESLMRFFLK